MNHWKKIGYGLEGKVVEDNLILIRNPKISEIPILKITLDSQGNVIEFCSIDGSSVGSVDARLFIINLVKDNLL